MQEWYKILDVAQEERDPRVLKKAYALKLKHTRPDEDPDAFMQLREAYDFAKYLSKHEEPRNEFDSNLGDKYERDPSYSANLDEDEGNYADAANMSPELEDCLNVIETLILSIPERYDQSNWSSIIEQAQNLSLDDYAIFENVLRENLVHRYAEYLRIVQTPRKGLKQRPPEEQTPMPRQTLAVIFKQMGWSLKGGMSHYVQQQLSFLLIEAGLIPRPAPQRVKRPWVGSWPDIIISSFLGLSFLFLVVSALLTSSTFTDYESLEIAERLEIEGHVKIDHEIENVNRDIVVRTQPDGTIQLEPRLWKDRHKLPDDSVEQFLKDIEVPDGFNLETNPLFSESENGIWDALDPEKRDALDQTTRDVIAEVEAAEPDGSWYEPRSREALASPKQPKLSLAKRRRNQHSNAMFFLGLLSVLCFWYFKGRIWRRIVSR